jgi:hypothetical protein
MLPKAIFLRQLPAGNDTKITTAEELPIPPSYGLPAAALLQTLPAWNS